MCPAPRAGTQRALRLGHALAPSRSHAWPGVSSTGQGRRAAVLATPCMAGFAQACCRRRTNAMVHANEGLLPHQRQHSRAHSARQQWTAHPWPLHTHAICKGATAAAAPPATGGGTRVDNAGRAASPWIIANPLQYRCERDGYLRVEEGSESRSWWPRCFWPDMWSSMRIALGARGFGKGACDVRAMGDGRTGGHGEQRGCGGQVRTLVNATASICAAATPASASASRTSSTTCCWWCSAVSFGKKPVPGGVMYLRHARPHEAPSRMLWAVPCEEASNDARGRKHAARGTRREAEDSRQ